MKRKFAETQSERWARIRRDREAQGISHSYRKTQTPSLQLEHNLVMRRLEEFRILESKSTK